jgi:hypothetical protein
MDQLDVARLYATAPHGATIMAFDAVEPIDCNPLRETSVRRYCVPQDSLPAVAHELTRELSVAGVKTFGFVAHQTYLPEDISYSGRVAYDGGAVGNLVIDVVRGLRRGQQSFTPENSYACPVAGGRVLRSRIVAQRSSMQFPDAYVSRMLRDVGPLVALRPQIDFEVYAGDGALFYHDMFLAKRPGSRSRD